MTSSTSRLQFKQRMATRLVLASLGLAVPAIAFSGTATSTGNNNNQSTTSNAQVRNSTGSSNTDSMWQKLDANHDGSVSRAEFDAYQRSMNAQGNNNLSTASGSSDTMATSGDIDASHLIGADVRNPRGQDLGQIRDLMIDVKSGKVQNAILSFGGFMNVGDKLFRYPLSAFSRSASGDLVLDVDQQKLQSSQGFDRNDWPEGRNTGANQNAHKTLWRASRLIGKDVADRQGEHLGEIKDLVIDMHNAKVDNVVLQYDRPWSLDNPMVAMPLRSFNLGDGRHDVSLNVDRSQIDAQVANASSTPSAGNNGIVLERWIFLVPDTMAANTAGDTSGAADTSSTNKTHSSSDSAAQAAKTSSSADNASAGNNVTSANNESSTASGNSR